MRPDQVADLEMLFIAEHHNPQCSWAIWRLNVRSPNGPYGPWWALAGADRGQRARQSMTRDGHGRYWSYRGRGTDSGVGRALPLMSHRCQSAAKFAVMHHAQVY